MTQEEIIRMAREAGFTDYYPERLTRFAALVAAHEREACAKVCDDMARTYWMSEAEEPMEFPDAHDCAAAIRARGEK